MRASGPSSRPAGRCHRPERGRRPARRSRCIAKIGDDPAGDALLLALARGRGGARRHPARREPSHGGAAGRQGRRPQRRGPVATGRRRVVLATRIGGEPGRWRRPQPPMSGTRGRRPRPALSARLPGRGRRPSGPPRPSPRGGRGGPLGGSPPAWSWRTRPSTLPDPPATALALAVGRGRRPDGVGPLIGAVLRRGRWWRRAGGCLRHHPWCGTTA